MDYALAYSRLIAHFRSIEVEGYSEKHHIMPRSLGGGDEAENLVRLTPKAHFLAHRLLAKIHGGSMWAALACMANPKTTSAIGVKVTSRIYDLIRRKDAIWRSEFYTENNPFRGKSHSAETRRKMRGPRPSASGVNNHRYGKKYENIGAIIVAIREYKPRPFVLDLTVRNRIDRLIVETPSELRRLRMQYLRSESMKANLRDVSGKRNPNYGNGAAIAGSRNPMFGKSHASSTKAKIGEKAKRRVVCPHCGKDGNIANMARWHFDNCRNAGDQAITASA